MTSAVVERVVKIIREQLALPEGLVITPESEIENDLGSDSLDNVELVMALEEEFEIEIADICAERCKTVQDVINTIDSIVRGVDIVPEIIEVNPKAKLPLHRIMDRCLGHATGSHETACPVRDSCARHASISHKNEPWTAVRPPFYSLCPDFNQQNFIEIEK